MTPTEFLCELSYPLRSPGALIALAMFFALASIILLAVTLVGLFAMASVWLAVVLTVAFARYLTMLAEARSRDEDVEPPGAEYFAMVGNLWTLFPAFIALSAIFIAGEFDEAGLDVAALGVVGVAAFLFPAMIGVLAITHAPWQSVNPLAVGQFIGRLGPEYGYALAAAALPAAVAAGLDALPTWVILAAGMLTSASFFAVVGGLVRSSGLAAEVRIEDPLEPDAETLAGRHERRRSAALNHAYGFASRGNRAGALAHIGDWIEREEPDPAAAEAWFFERMLGWENTDAALVFARQRLKHLLAAGDQVEAVKLMMRCRLLNERFRPEAEDFEAAVAAARACRNDELAAALERL